MSNIIDRKKVDQRLSELWELNKTLRAEDVVEDARDPDNPLHLYFEWDDRIAGARYRIQQARDLIRSFREEYVADRGMVPDHRPSFSPKYVRDTTVEPDKQGYIPLSIVRTRKEESRDTILIEVSRILGCINRAKAISRVLKLESYFENLLVRTQEIQQILYDLSEETRTKKKVSSK